MSFFWQGRLGEKPSDLLKHYYAETMREPLFLEALHQWDKAQVVVLGEQGIAPDEAIACLLKSVAEMEKEGVVEARKALWNVIHGGEEYMRKHCEEEKSGWLHLGRSSPSLRVVASRIAFRSLQLQIMATALDMRQKQRDRREVLQRVVRHLPVEAPAVLDWWNKHATTILGEKDALAQLAAQGAQPAPMSREEFARYLRAEAEKWAGVVKASGAKVD